MTPFWNGLSRRERIIAVLCAVVVVCAGVWQGIVVPYAAFLDSLQTQTEAKEILLAKYQRLIASGSVAVNSKQSRDRSIDRVAPQQEMARLLKEIEAIAQSSSIRIQDLKPASISGKDSTPEYKVDIQTVAGLAALSKFLYRIQTSPLALRASRFSLTSATGSSGENKLRLTMTVLRD